MTDEKDLESEIEKILGGAGLSLLEFSVSRHRGNVKVKAVVYSPSGTGTDECTKAYRLILPQVQLILNVQTPDIEVSSPGIDRIIRSAKEWKAFVGQAVKILMKDRNEWTAGRLTGFVDDRIEFIGPEGPVTIEVSSIAKARLDSSHKGE